MRFVIGSILIGTVSVLLASNCPAATAELQLQSQAGDYIGQGQTFDIPYQTPADTVSAQIRRHLATGEPAELLFVLDSAAAGNQFSTVFFGTDALGIPIQPGVYNNAQRADFAAAGHPGLDISFQNRGSNTVTGTFTIDYVTFDPSQTMIDTFKATFEQHSEGFAPALFGTFIYDAQVPEPGSLSLLTGGLLMLMQRKRRSKSANA